ncbi:NAD-dependent epimerase/dehydratase family protein [Pseudoalteromonas piscicida]|uniref:NAD-dependent epimerase/dehydratase family protein n=1 Tax=Pseudoalteromonas piscicida TaxID=43662 RepID=A0AAD0W5Z8_PSEO7|nr:NAD-dependent epimerase/dehydratase family protein [Pseudoalteromonas piscicida]ASD69525.1 NAD-dependent dehydratase [Pseudoalteromonas piscicida]AXR00135.1 NAD-dependent epimerase/dehydratase family protein [Pseudoalteromonas piscicida]AXR04116.1 NAD-dependent epimerase/dehydratase family protein [Pseudoalteromonas piscicida]
MRKIFITGAGGFIGRHLVAELLKRDVVITALMLPGESVPTEWGSKVRIITGDVRELVELDDDIGAFDTIFHLAAIVSDWGGKREHVDITVNGTKQAIELAVKNSARFVVTTSVAAFGSAMGSGFLDESTPCGKPASNYEYVKQIQEQVTLEAVTQRGLNAVIIRPANVYGVGSVWVTRFIDLMNQKKPVLMGDGKWDAGLVHVQHVVQGLILAAEKADIGSGEIFIIADEPGVTWQNYLAALSEALELPEAKGIPNWLARILAPVLEWIGHLVNQKNAPLVTNLAYRLVGVESIFVNKKAKQKLGYKPNITLDKAMEEIKQYYSSKNCN